MKKLVSILFCLMLALGMTGCTKVDTGTTTAVESSAEAEQTTSQAEQATADTAAGQSNNNHSTEDIGMKLLINDVEIPVSWENCTAVEELMAEVSNGSITVSMSMYGGWEQVGSLGHSYTRADRQMTAVNGDIVLYNGNQIVVFYGANSWSYTKLGRMNLSADEVTEVLSKGDVTLKIIK